MVKRKRDLSGALNEKHATKKKTTTNRLLNPFEAKPNKRVKHKVLNRPMKGSERNVALARSLANEKRKRTLLVDYKSSNKANLFADRRFGENNEKLSEEEKILERFKRLRSKKSLYDLSDTDKASSKNIKFTHLGQTINDNDDVSAREAREFEERLREEQLDEEDIVHNMDATELMSALKRGDHTMMSELKRSKKEIMEEVIAKAKLFKMQRQKEKEEDEEERDRLDDLFKGMMHDGLFHMRPTKNERKELQIQQMMNRTEKGDTSTDQKLDFDDETEEKDEYEKTVAKLIFEARAAASDRTMTPEEKASRELEKLKEQQEDLQRRMEGRIDDEEDDIDNKKSKQKKKSLKLQKSNDENSSDDEEIEKKAPVLDRFGNEIEPLDSSSSDDNLDDEDSDEPSESEDEEDDENIDEPKKSRVEIENEKYARRIEIMNQAKEECPFIIECPESHLAFVEFLKKYPTTSIETIVSRVRKSNSIHLKSENKEKMTRFLEIMIHHLCFLLDSEIEGPDKSEEIRMCMCALYDLATNSPDVASQEFCGHLQKLHARFSKERRNASSYDSLGGDYGCNSISVVQSLNVSSKKRGGHKGAKGKALLELEKLEEEHAFKVYGGGMKTSDCRCWPSPGDIGFFRAVESIFPVTDFRHLVISPAQLLLGQSLTQCPLRGPRDVIASLCTCQLLLDYVKEAERLSPEVPMVLEGLLRNAFFENSAFSEENENIPYPPIVLMNASNGQGTMSLSWLNKGIQGAFTNAISQTTLSLRSLSYNDDFAYGDLNICVQVLYALFDLIKLCTQINAKSVGCEALLLGIHKSMEHAAVKIESLRVLTKNGKKTKKKIEFNESLFTSFENCQKYVAQTIAVNMKNRKGMRLLEKSARGIQSITPMFNENYTWTKDGHDTDKTRVETKRLKKELKKERKVVARELRKDAVFLSEIKQQEKQKHLDGLRAERQKNYNFMMEQTGVINKAVREYGAKGGGATGADMRGRKRK